MGAQNADRAVFDGIFIPHWREWGYGFVEYSTHLLEGPIPPDLGFSHPFQPAEEDERLSR